MHSIPHPFRVYSSPQLQGDSALTTGEEQAFARMDSLYRRLVGYLPEAVYCCDTSGRITLFNDAALRLWGRVPELGVDRWCGAYRIYQPDGTLVPHAQCAMAMLLAERQERGSAEAIIERPDGTRRVVLAHPQLVKEGNVVLGAVNVAIDITERKHAENLLRDADRRKDEFLAMLAHELRNPLAPVRTAAEVLKRINIADPTASQSVEIIERQVHQLARLVDDLLDVARMGRGEVLLKKSHVLLSNVLSNAIDVVMPEIERRAHTLDVERPPCDPTLYCDPVRVAQMIGNLLHNATKYTPARGSLRLAATVQDCDLIIRVTDNGKGIDPRMLDRIFELFSRAGPNGEVADGLGIGLSVVRSMATLHEGTVTAHSEGLGQGSEFVLRLPVVTAPEAEEVPAEPRAAAPANAQKILLVDDNVDSALALQTLLEFEGHSVQTAHDAFSALELADRFCADAFVIDIGLPGMDGCELVRRLRRRPESAGSTMVAMSGWGAPEDVRRAMEAGFDRHLSKPASFASIIDALEHHYTR